MTSIDNYAWPHVPAKFYFSGKKGLPLTRACGGSRSILGACGYSGEDVMYGFGFRASDLRLPSLFESTSWTLLRYLRGLELEVGVFLSNVGSDACLLVE
jgi:hypothetical protein